MIAEFKVFASIADRISLWCHGLRYHITSVMPCRDGCLLIECSCGGHVQVRQEDDGWSAEVENVTCRRWLLVAKLRRLTIPTARAREIKTKETKR